MFIIDHFGQDYGVHFNGPPSPSRPSHSRARLFPPNPDVPQAGQGKPVDPTDAPPAPPRNSRTLCYHFAKDGETVQGGAVPAAAAKLKLAFFNGQLCPPAH